MLIVLFNILENTIIHTEIQGHLNDFSKINQFREYIKTLLNKTQMNRFSDSFDAYTTICVNILYDSKERPDNFNDRKIYPMVQ